jgi:mannosyltransferase
MARILDFPAGRARVTAAESGPSRRRPDWALAVPSAVTLAVTLWGITARPYWGDEADTVSAVSRSLPQLFRLLWHVDAVHGLYYLLLWPVARVAGTGELAARLPSVLAMAVAALGITLIGRDLSSRRTGLCAGLVFAALPAVSQQAQDARPYAMVTAAAVLASWRFIAVVASPRPARFAGYGLSLVLLGYLHLFGLLIVLAHGLTLLALGRRARWGAASAVRGWLVTVATAGAAVAPVVIEGWRQRGQIAWIARPGWSDVGFAAEWLAAGSAASAVVLALLALAGARARRGGRGRALTWLALPWLLVPPACLMLVSQVIPVYSFRYVIFSLPAVALLAGAGLAALTRGDDPPEPPEGADGAWAASSQAPSRVLAPGDDGAGAQRLWGLSRVPGWVLRGAALALIVALAARAQLGLRAPGSGPAGGVQAAAGILTARERPGDAIVYAGGIPPWYLVYPRAFWPLRDIGLAQPGPAAGRLYGSSVALPVLLRRERAVPRIWVLETSHGWLDPSRYLAPGFRLVHRWQPGQGLAGLALYQRSGPRP